MRRNKVIIIMLTTMLLCIAPFFVMQADAMVTGSLTTPVNGFSVIDSNHVYLGSYPQREVVGEASQSGVYGQSWGTTSSTTNDSYIVDSELYTTLKNLSEDKWDSNGDTTVDGTKYRRIKKSNATYSTSGSGYYYNWSDSTSYHYFKYEPIKWRVLQSTEDDAFLLCDIAIDDQKYNLSNTSITWEESTIRSFLNSYGSSSNSYGKNYSGAGFYDTAFNATEKGAIKTTEVVNDANKTYGTSGGNDTQDKVFLLSEDEVYGSKATDYGFAKSYSTYDTARQIKSSSYAKAMGTYSNGSNSYLGNCHWWLRSPGFSAYIAVYVGDLGSVDQYGNYVCNDNYGLLPALHINLKSNNPITAEVKIDDITLSSDVMCYTGEELTPAVTIKGLTEGEDFEVGYEDNTEIGTAKVIVTGKGEWSGTLTKTFEIKYDINEVAFGLFPDSYTYNGEECKPEIISSLAAGTEYLYEYCDNTNAGTAKVTIVGRGDYYGTKVLTYTINPKSISNMDAELEYETCIYNKSAQKPSVTIDGLTADTDFDVAYSNNTDAGTATVTINGKGNYTGTVEMNFTIEKCDISGMTATLSQDEYVQDGSEKKPTVTIKGLTSGVDFEVAYSDNVAIGTATATITGIGNYTGTITKRYRIGRNISGFTATLSQDNYTYDGTAKEPAVTIEGLEQGKDFTVSYSDNINAGTATVTVKSAGEYVGKITKTFTISKYNYNESTSTGSLTTPVNGFSVIDSKHVYFGSYPQREVVGEASQSGVYGKTWGTTSDATNDSYIVDSELYTTLKNLSEDKWDSNGDTTVEGTKYRRIKESNATYSTSDNTSYYNWSDSTSYHYFKYEPIKWRVLQSTEDDAFLLCDMAIDDQKYNLSTEAITWEKSTIRRFLNSYDGSSNSSGKNYSGAGFYDTAFNATEKGAIKTTKVVNDNNKRYKTDGGNDTQDKVFLLSEDEVYGSKATDYGFAKSYSTYDTARQIKSSSYAKAMGTYSNDSSSYLGNCYWWLRSPGTFADYAVFVDDFGNVHQDGKYVGSSSSGLLPALHINLKSNNPITVAVKLDDITLSSDVMWYTGEELTPAVTIDGLTENEDFEVRYEDNIEFGTARVIVTGKGEWSGTLTKTFEIIDADTVQLDESSYTYDGEAKEPGVVVKGIGEDTMLDPATDYDIEYINNVDAGTATARIKLKGNYEGTLDKTFTINPQDISGKEATLSLETYICKPNAEERDEKKPDVTVEGLDAETDYTVEYSDNINPGTAKVTIRGKGNYTGEIVKSFRIGFTMSGTVELSQTSYIYDGTEKRPTATLAGYIEGNDFEVSYLNNVEVGTATVKLVGIGNYIGTKAASFTIEKGNLKNASIEFTSEHYAYYDTAVTPEVVVKIGDSTISSDNYTVSYSNNKAAGTGTATVNSKESGSVSGSISKKFTIHSLTKVSAKSATCKDFGNTEYYKCSCGKYYSDKFGTNEIAKDSWIVNKTEHDYEDVELQPATVDADGYKKHERCSFCGAEKNKVVIPQIDAASITLAETSFIVDGTEHEPEISTIKDIEGNELNPDTDYEISYEDNKYKGTGKAIITFKGNYSGEVARKFTINKKGTDGIAMSIAENEREYTYDGTAKEPEVTVTWNEGEDFPAENYDVVYENNTDAGTATARVVLKGDYYEGELVENYTIHKADYTLDVEQTEIKVRAKKTAQINATGTGNIVYTTANKSIATVSASGIVKGVKIGTTTITVLIAGDKNHNEARATVNVIVPTVITKAVLTKTSYTYNGEVQKPGIKSVNGSTKLQPDTDYTVEYKDSNNSECDSPVEAGTYKVVITGIGKYDGTVTQSFTIAKAANTISAESTATTIYVGKKKAEITASAKEDAGITYSLDKTSKKYVNIVDDGEGKATLTAIKAGTAKVTVTSAATDNYKASSKTISITVKSPVDVSASKVTSVGTAVWNGGEEINPAVTVKSGKTTFKSGTDYKIRYELVNTGEGTDDDWDVGDTVKVTVDATDEDAFACKGTIVKNVVITKATQTATATAPSTIYYGEGKEPVKIDVSGIPGFDSSAPANDDKNPTITYKSSSTKIATVSSDGKITPIKAGKVTITVNIGETTHYSAKSIKLTVNVKAATKLTSKNVKITAAYNDGENVVPKVTVTGFKEGTDYTVEYNYTKLYEVQESEEGGEGEESPRQVAKAIAIDDPIDVTVKAVAASGGCLGTYTATVKVGKGEQSITIDSQPTTVKVKATTPTFTINGVKEAAKVDVTTKTYAKINKLGIDQDGNYQFSITGVKKGTATVTVKIGATSKYNAKTLTFKVKVSK